MASMIRKHFLLPKYQIDFLESLNDIPSSEHVRRAIDEYIGKHKKGAEASASASVRNK